MIERLPARFRTPRVARAMLSPSAIVMAGAGAALGILGGLPILAAAGIGAAAWAGRVLLAVPGGGRRDQIDPFALKEPWRRFVADALRAQRRFDRTLERCRPGPLKERLGTLAERIDHGVRECWRVAQYGQELDSAVRHLDAGAVRREWDEARDELEDASSEQERAAIERTQQALRAQMDSIGRLESVAADARNRLRVLNAQLDEAVARAVELTVHTGDVSQVAPVSADVDMIVGELEALREALEETSGTSGTQQGGLA